MSVKLELIGGVAVIGIDDGKVNALNLALLQQINDALESAEALNTGVVIIGRPGILSAGFDLKQMMTEDSVACSLLRAGAELCLRLMTFRRPVVSACTGHAYPMGAFLLLSSDYRIGADGPFKIGMNEAKIGLVMPTFAFELARWRLTPPAFNKTILTGEMFTPNEAVSAGFLDEVCDANALASVAISKAAELSAMPANAHVQIKRKLRAPLLEAIRHAIDTELTEDAFRAARLAVAS